MISKPESTTINISQILSFDRINMNVTDLKAPLVRNTLGWSFQVEKYNTTSNAENTTIASTNTTNNSNDSAISAGVVWQANRGVALKVVGMSNPHRNQHDCTYGIILKRWKQPRMTCSIMNRFDFTKQQFTCMGVGLEMDTDASSVLFGEDYYRTGQSGSYHMSSDVPETRAALP
jgi:hypothetical protein